MKITQRFTRDYEDPSAAKASTFWGLKARRDGERNWKGLDPPPPPGVSGRQSSTLYRGQGGGIAYPKQKIAEMANQDGERRGSGHGARCPVSGRAISGSFVAVSLALSVSLFKVSRRSPERFRLHFLAGNGTLNCHGCSAARGQIRPCN